jgi:hypothetical protein
MSSCSNTWASDSNSNTISVTSWSVKFYPFSHTAKCALSQLRTQQTQHLLNLWFKHQQCLACRMLLLWEESDWSVPLKTHIGMNLQFKIVTTKSLWQNEGYLPMLSYCTNKSNNCLCSFLSSSTACIWTHLTQHPNKPTLPQNLNIIISLKHKQRLRKYNDVYSQLQIFWHTISTYSRSFLKGLI